MAPPPPTTSQLLLDQSDENAPPMSSSLIRRLAGAALRLRGLRRATLVTGALNLAVAVLGPLLIVLLLRRCEAREKVPVWGVSAAAVARIVGMVAAGVAQGVTAVAIRRSGGDGMNQNRELRRLRKMRYRRWLWWTRFGLAVTALQFLIAFYLLIAVARDLSVDGASKKCSMGQHIEGGGKNQMLMISFLILVWLVVIVQCFTGSDVLRWRSFYATHDTAWKAHYQEVFDHGIREAFCCLGRAKYLSVSEEDEIYSVARLLGDLVAYRASGTGHLELLAGLALLQRHKPPQNVYSESMEAPEARIQEAAVFHPFAEAAYTGPLLDIGRNPILFPCAWLWRQGVLTPWTRSRRPVLEGDNWWRGHASAFLKYAKLPPEALRCGRVRQTRREAAYFVVVVHDLRSVVIAIRGTETPEDLITDGLCKESSLSMDDLDGLINGYQLPSHVREYILSSFPHYGHSGIIESARELFMQIDGQSGGESSPSETSGFLSSLLGIGGECHGYNVRIVGHSLGGAVAAMLGVRLYGRYPNLHVYAYGPLPCVDSIVAEACSDFVTSIVYNDEFSARLSVNSILRLRAAAISALSVDSSGDSEMISKLVRKILHMKKYNDNGGNQRSPSPLMPGRDIVEDNHVHKRKQFKHTIKGGAFLCGYAVSCVMNSPEHQPCSHAKDNFQLPSGIVSEPGILSDRGDYTFTADSSPSVPVLYHERAPIFDDDDPDTNTLKDSIYECSKSEFHENNFFGLSNDYNATYCDSPPNFSSIGDQPSPFPDSSPSSSVSSGDSPEVFLPGLVIHMVPEERSVLPIWKSWKANDRKQLYKAFVANRESFKEIVVTPYMFLDHLPWRCQYALQRVVETQKMKSQLTDDTLNEANAA